MGMPKATAADEMPGNLLCMSFFIIIYYACYKRTFATLLTVCNPRQDSEPGYQRKSSQSVFKEDHEFASIQSKAIGLRKASGIPKELTTASA